MKNCSRYAKYLLKKLTPTIGTLRSVAIINTHGINETVSS
jgi:hypothetical protein